MPVGSGPYGSMSIGETAVIPTAAAVANAVHDAVGVRVTTLPVTAEKVFEALQAKRVIGAAHRAAALTPVRRRGAPLSERDAIRTATVITRKAVRPDNWLNAGRKPGRL